MAPFLNFMEMQIEEGAPPPSAISAQYWRVRETSFVSYPAAGEIEFAELGGTVHAGGTAISSGDLGGGAASNAFDGNGGTAWLGASASNNLWIGKNFGSPVPVNVVRYKGRGNGQYFSNAVVEYSSDGSSWNTAWTISSFPAETDVLLMSYPDPAATIGQRTLWRLNVSDVNAGGGVSIVELEFRLDVGGANTFGAGLAYGRDNGNPVANAIDGNAGTFWGTTDPTPKIFYYEFENHKDIIEIAITSRPSFAAQAPKDFKLQSSPDGTTWTDRITVTGQTGWSAGGETRIFN